mmetsp:Transcript_17480/g.48291  ORF Transcript_17480/g.48291 Transcript_17480/m.48291 type:complete len:249 (-) Transcript_17480:163-909(-)
MLPDRCCCAGEGGAQICHDDVERIVSVTLPPLSLNDGTIEGVISAWLEQALRPVVAQVHDLQKQVQRCEVRIEELDSHRTPAEPDGWPVQAPCIAACRVPGSTAILADCGGTANLDEVLAEQAELLRLVEEGQRRVDALQQKVGSAVGLQTNVTLAEPMQKTTVEQISELKDAVTKFGDMILDFGSPIGKTMNTQDWLAMYAETRQEVDECRRRVDSLMSLLQQGTSRVVCHSSPEQDRSNDEHMYTL